MYLPPINTGLLTDIHLENLIPISGPLGDVIKNAVHTAIQVIDPQQDTPATLPVIETTSPQEAQHVHSNLDTAISALGALLKLRWLIPDQLEPILELLAKALVLVKDWVK